MCPKQKLIANVQSLMTDVGLMVVAAHTKTLAPGCCRIDRHDYMMQHFFTDEAVYMFG